MKYSAKSARIRGLIFAAGIIAIDQFSKKFFAGTLTQGTGLEVFSFFNLNIVFNRGISFGMLAGNAAWVPQALIIATSLIALILFFWLMRARELSVIIALGFIIGGAVGNIIDRVRYGFVIDFLDFHLGHYHWPAFNIADTAVFMGVVILVLTSIVKPETNL